ncbi:MULTISPECIES: MMPL family transporter [unclassified Microbacterium]|uniref:MMPL family transporter n=1 Tax=unclassified Microbacterium TaxID=2609290 RepID=UPI00214C3BCA|nr:MULTISPECIES: MMPL family transporter [unclassified Microbacterium]MCR2784796.1 MMPL family transporter [Microbacterium sp. zg.B96]WIM16335.1 MMPL family transporter [Microbacterium sp. zg-B96]
MGNPAARRRESASRGARIAITATVIVLWFAIFLGGGRMFSQLNDLGTNDRVHFLPDSAESTQVDRLDDEFRVQGYSYAVAVFTFDEPLDDHAAPLIERQVQRMPQIEGLALFRSTPLIVSDDRLAAEFVIPVDSQGALDETVAQLRTGLQEAVPDATAVYITGGAGFAADVIAAFSGIDGLLLLAALGAVLLILITVYRSPLLPLIVVFTSLAALCGAVLVVAGLARSGAVLLAGQTQGILLILVVGASTNYALLYISRYTEALARGRSKWDATWDALKGCWKPILASGLTVIAALMVLLVSELGSNRTLGPIASIGIAFALLATFTLLPALLMWAGRAAFWPRRLVAHEQHADVVAGAGLWPRVARFVARRHRRVWIVTGLALIVMALGLTQLRADGSPSSEYVMGQSQARDGLAVLAEHYPAGSGTPVVVVVDAPRMLEVTAAILQVEGVDHTRVATLGGPTPVTPDGIQPFAAGSGIALAPLVIDNRVLLEATLDHAPDTPEAEAVVRELRTALDRVGADVLVGGQTAIDVDANEAALRDRGVIIPLVLLAIFAVLVALLRSLVAPVIVIGSVALSYGAALGVSAIVFNELFGFSGADPTVPLFAFVFLIALGVDYNIFLMARAREETVVHGARAGILRSLVLTGGVITSAGVVLAATFAALGVLPLLFLTQIAFIVAFGVLLDTFVVRTLLVPALVYDLDFRSWWPSAHAVRPAPVVATQPEREHASV